MANIKHYNINASLEGWFKFEVTRIEKCDVLATLASLKTGFPNHKFSVSGIPFECSYSVDLDNL